MFTKPCWQLANLTVFSNLFLLRSEHLHYCVVLSTKKCFVIWFSYLKVKCLCLKPPTLINSKHPQKMLLCRLLTYLSYCIVNWIFGVFGQLVVQKKQKNFRLIIEDHLLFCFFIDLTIYLFYHTLQVSCNLKIMRLMMLLN